MPDLREEMARLKKSLDALTEDAYRLFAKYPAPGMDARRIRANLRGISPELFARYNDAYFGCGSIEFGVGQGKRKLRTAWRRPVSTTLHAS